MVKKVSNIIYVLCFISVSLAGFMTPLVSQAAPSNVAVSNVGTQTVGSATFYSSTQLFVTWVPPLGETVDHYVITATESVMNTSVSVNASGTAASALIDGLKAATTYTVTVNACSNSSCSVYTSASSTGSTSEEYWQLQGSGNGYDNMTKNVDEGSVLSWVMRWGSEVGENAGKYQYYYKTNATDREGIGIATTSGKSDDSSMPQIPFTPITTVGLRSACSSALGSNISACPNTAAYEIDSVQAVPMTNGTIRAFFEASDIRDNKTTRIYSIDSKDGLVGQDFNNSVSQSYCGGIGYTDYATGGPCAPTLLVDVRGTNPLLNARQFKIGYDWNANWRWDGANGTFMVITGEDTCNKYTSGLFYATLNNGTWTVLKDNSNCAKPLVPLAHGPVLVPLGSVAYKLYYEDATDGQTSGKPLRLMYGNGAITGNVSKVDFDDWESYNNARQVNFLWPDGSQLDAQDEAGLGDHMILTPAGDLSKQLMFLNLGGFDNTKWNKGSAGLGMAILLNAASEVDTTVPTVTITSPTSDATYTTTSSTISLGGTASDTSNTLSKVTWSSSNSKNGIADGTSAWTISNINLSLGDNTIMVIATDDAGNSGQDAIKVTYEECQLTALEADGDSSLHVHDSSVVTVAVTANGAGCDLSGLEVDAKIKGNGKNALFDNGEKTATETTDSNGEATFNVLAKKKGSVNIQFTITGTELKDTFKIKIK